MATNNKKSKFYRVASNCIFAGYPRLDNFQFHCLDGQRAPLESQVLFGKKFPNTVYLSWKQD